VDEDNHFYRTTLIRYMRIYEAWEKPEKAAEYREMLRR